MVVAWRFVAVVFATLFVAAVAGGVEEEECTSAYNYLAGCLTFVSGPDVIPNPVCCGGVSHLSMNDPHCLCIIIQELDDNPNVNFTKACALPHQCSAAVDPAQCPYLAMPPGHSLPPSLPPGLYAPVPSGDSAASPRNTVRGVTWRLVALAALFTALLNSNLW